ncbi:hypothetical protein LGH83_04420 [Lichenihabitans sp. PAMC28606]|uniref:hypothetical protein n=1 Tax=Lichenihabitans sp. PAMC28606 TaxID=2880932 RepID=UPI001D0A62BC|nr:hypothetical protein [Lichenihabitans sp. PAMC28606]UDL95471.1 hypothetical protein LGH83_04420 [Lichenihabitans sp. PAMC28606]
MAEAPDPTTVMAIAVRAGATAYLAALKEHGDTGTAGFVSIHLPVDETHKPMIRALADFGGGSFDGWTCDFKLRSDFETQQPVQSMKVQQAGCEACAAVLRQHGFIPMIRSQLD